MGSTTRRTGPQLPEASRARTNRLWRPSSRRRTWRGTIRPASFESVPSIGATVSGIGATGTPRSPMNASAATPGARSAALLVRPPEDHDARVRRVLRPARVERHARACVIGAGQQRGRLGDVEDAGARIGVAAGRPDVARAAHERVDDGIRASRPGTCLPAARRRP